MRTIALTGDTARTDCAARPNAALIAAECGIPVFDVVVPVYNEEATLADSVRAHHRTSAIRRPVETQSYGFRPRPACPLP
ncbi:MAG: hypothetical protein ACRDUT_10140 [Mycobacterium sp.]